MSTFQKTEETRAFNIALDEKLRSEGIVDRDPFLNLCDAYTFQATSNVAWVLAKLKILRDRFDLGLGLLGYSPATGVQIEVATRLELARW